MPAHGDDQWKADALAVGGGVLAKTSLFRLAQGWQSGIWSRGGPGRQSARLGIVNVTAKTY